MVCFAATGEAVPKAGDEDAGVVKTDDVSLGEAAWEDRLAFAVGKTVAGQEAAGQILAALVLLVDLEGQHLDNHLVSCAHPSPVVSKTYP